MQPHETTSLPPVFGDALEAAVADWERGQKVARLWARDSTLWTGADEDQWLGWLHPATSPSRNSTLAARVSSRALRDAFDDVVLLGMGGSSLCAEVLASSFGPTDGCPTLRVLDSTDPAQIRSCEEQIALDRTLFLTSSKSGSTLESSILLQYFLDRVQQTVGLETAGDRFVAITDPGSPLETVATQHRFRAVFHGVPDIGGRFSALSVFGTIPAAAMGIDVEPLIQSIALGPVRVVGRRRRRHPRPLKRFVLNPVDRNHAAGMQGYEQLPIDPFRQIGICVEQLVEPLENRP